MKNKVFLVSAKDCGKTAGKALEKEKFVAAILKQLSLPQKKESCMEVFSQPVSVLLNRKGEIMAWSAPAANLYGYEAAEMVGQQLAKLYPKAKDTIATVAAHLGQAASAGFFETEVLHLRKDQSSVPVRLVLTRLDGNNGALIGFTLVISNPPIDVAGSDVWLAQKGLKEELQKSITDLGDYKHALDESAIVAVTNQKGIITHVNDNFCRISRYSREELLGQDHRIINSGYHSKETIRDLWVTIANGKIWRGELRNRAKDGSFYWVDTTIVPFLNKLGKPYQYLAIRSDITQRKLVQEQLQRVNEQLETRVRERTVELTESLEREKELSDMKSRFVSMASHEFRTPLSAILSSVSLIEHYAGPEQAKNRLRHITRIKSSVKNLTNILDDFLSLEKLEHGQVDVCVSEFDLRLFLEELLEDVEGLVRKKAQRLTADYKGEQKVMQDKKMLRNVMLNLLSNAIKYSAEEKNISVCTVAQNGTIQIAITDEGFGIPTDAQPYLFTRFFRAKNVTNLQGTGLGLHIVKRYVELMKGSIWFKSVEGKGTTFYVSFPAMFA